MPSSVIRSMRFDPRTRTLVIAFQGGRGVYRYFGVEMDEWVEFLASGSKGTYLNEVFKARGHQFEKVPERDYFRWMAERRREAGGEGLGWGEARREHAGGVAGIGKKQIPADDNL